MKRFVLALPVVLLALSLDRILPEKSPKPAAKRTVALEEGVASLPGLNNGRFGRSGDALNLVFVGSAESVRESLSKAGWTELPGTIRASIAGGLVELVSGKPIASAPPMNEYWLDGRRQDMNWAIPVKFIEARHHFRLWDTGMRDPRGRAIWWGSGDRDLSVRWHDLSHVPDPDMNAERDWVAASLKESPLLERITLMPVERIPRGGVNDKGYAFHTDGRVALIELR
jgi:hypothetical protein